MIIVIFFLSFIAALMFIYDLYPVFLNKYSRKQKEKLEVFVKELPRRGRETEKIHLKRIYIICPILFAIIGLIGFKNIIGLGGAIIGLVFANIVIKARLAARRAKFNKQLVDALMIVSGSLKAGFSLQQAFEVLVHEMPKPMSEEFDTVVRENQMGVSLEESLYALKKRMSSDELDLIVTAILVARETGGDLTQLFSQLVLTIRERDKLQRRVQVLCVQGKLQGWIMGILPIAFAIFIYKVNPGNFNIMLKDKMGQMLLFWAVISEIIGIFFIKKLSKVEV